MTDELTPLTSRTSSFGIIDSVTQLEALLPVRANPGETWNVSATAMRLYATEQEVAEVLALPCHDGLLSVSEEVYRY